VKFWEHPLNAEISNFLAWLVGKVDVRRLTHEQESIILRAGKKVFEDAGLSKGPDATPDVIAVFRHRLHVMKTKTMELCPQLTQTVKNFDDPDNQQVLSFQHWITEQVLAGVITDEFSLQIERAGDAAFEAAGGYSAHADMPRTFRSQLQAMQNAVVEIRPDLAEEVRKWSTGMSGRQ